WASPTASSSPRRSPSPRPPPSPSPPTRAATTSSRARPKSFSASWPPRSTRGSPSSTRPRKTSRPYDVAPGGAGYAPLAASGVRHLLSRAETILSCPTRHCDDACHLCLLSFDTARCGRLLNRHPALEFVRRCLAHWSMCDYRGVVGELIEGGVIVS